MKLGMEAAYIVSPDEGDPLRHYLEGLDARGQIVMEMRFQHDLSFREIGERLGLHETTVRDIITASLEQIKGELCD